MFQQGGGPGGGPERFTEMREKLNQDAQKALAGILKPEQKTRANEIFYQAQGYRAFMLPQVAEKLDLTEDQRQEIRTDPRAVGRGHADGDGGDPPERRRGRAPRLPGDRRQDAGGPEGDHREGPRRPDRRAEDDLERDDRRADRAARHGLRRLRRSRPGWPRRPGRPAAPAVPAAVAPAATTRTTERPRPPAADSHGSRRARRPPPRPSFCAPAPPASLRRPSAPSCTTPDPRDRPPPSPGRCPLGAPTSIPDRSP